MALYRVFSIGTLLLLSCGGCKPNTNTTDTSTAKPPASTATAPTADASTVNSAPPGVEPAEMAATDAASSAADAATLNPELAPEPIPAGKWTVQRLIALTQGGPTLIDLAFRVGDQELQYANSQLMQPIESSLMEKLGESATWERLLQLPLIQSGWLGNLVSSDENQPLIRMYDTNNDAQVQLDELEAFLTRGLSRSLPFTLQDAGVQPGRDNNAFGILDVNRDNVLSLLEMEQGHGLLSKYDLDGDASLTPGELSSQDTAMNGAMQPGAARSMLKTSSLLFEPVQLDSTTPSNAADDRKRWQRKTNQLLEHYSFVGTISREQWPKWPDEQWELIDKNRDNSIDKRELMDIFHISAPIRIAVQLADPRQTDAKTRWYFETNLKATQWHSSLNSAVLHSPQLHLQLSLDDVINSRLISTLQSRLNQALRDDQLKQSLLQQLELKENALTVADADDDKTISPSEANAVWNWIIARGAARLQGRWLVSAKPWFQLVDQDHNQIVSEVELDQLAGRFNLYDDNHDQEIDQSELPMVTQLLLSRRDQRLNLSPTTPDSPDSPADDGSWFSAMDTNRDGSISRLEFLGTSAQFKLLDLNHDNFVSSQEAGKN